MPGESAGQGNMEVAAMDCIVCVILAYISLYLSMYVSGDLKGFVCTPKQFYHQSPVLGRDFLTSCDIYRI